MKLGRKALMLQLTVATLSVVLSILVIRTVVFPLFVEMQKGLIEDNERRAIEAILEDRDYRMSMAGDYGAWDQTFEFVIDPASHREFVYENMAFSALRNLNVDAFVVFDLAGHIVRGVVIHPGSGEMGEFGDILLDADETIAAMNTSDHSTARKSGVIRTSLFPLDFASHPVIQTDRSGKPNGFVVLGSFLTPEYLLDAGSRHAIRMGAIYSDSTRWPTHAELRQSLAATSVEGDSLTRVPIDDIRGEPALLLEIRTPESTMIAGKRVTLTATVFLVLVSLLLLAINQRSIKRLIVNPLDALTRHVESLEDGADFSSQLGLSREDEIGVLASEFNALMKRLEKTELLLRSDRLHGEDRRHAETVRASALSLLTIINDVLDFSKIESGKFTLDPQPFSPRDCLDEIIRILSHGAKEKGLELNTHVSPDVPDYLVADSARLRQVLINLVGNAIKFTEHGHVNVRIESERAEAGCVRVRFSVSDTGIGVPESDRESIFESFSQSDESSSRNFGGTGLGLAISSRIVAQMGGAIELQSKVGEGSNFSFAIDFDAAPGNLASPNGKPLDEKPNARVTGIAVDRRSADRPWQKPTFDALVLIVEDNPVNQKVALGMLASLGCRCDVAENGIEGVAAVRNQRYDLVLMDCQMPQLDGFEATRRIRDWESGRDARPQTIIAVTANAMEDDRQRCVDAGMSDYLPKPFTLAQLRSMLAKHLPMGEPPAGASPRDDTALDGRPRVNRTPG